MLRFFVCSFAYLLALTLGPQLEACPLTPAEIRLQDLRPLQLSVGMSEVEKRKSRWLKMSQSQQQAYLKKNPMQIVIGPRCWLYLVDGHHLGRALWDLGIILVPQNTLDDLSHLSLENFLHELQVRQWIWLFDENDQPKTFADLPSQLGSLTDDPFRSLAGELRGVSYDESSTPFQQFFWARYFRSYLRIEILRDLPFLAKDFAHQLAQQPQARALPGYRGP